jgi:hypothetical protein
MNLRIGILIGLAVLALLAVLWNYRAQTQRGLKLATQTVQMAPSYSSNMAYYHGLVAITHESAAKDAYSPPTPIARSARPGSFSDLAYQESLLRRMIEQAGTDGRKDIEQELLGIYKTKFGRAPHDQSMVQPTRSIATSISTVTARRHSVSVHA